MCMVGREWSTLRNVLQPEWMTGLRYQREGYRSQDHWSRHGALVVSWLYVVPRLSGGGNMPRLSVGCLLQAISAYLHGVAAKRAKDPQRIVQVQHLKGTHAADGQRYVQPE